MRLRSMTALAALAIGVGLAGFTVTGCQSLVVGPQIPVGDSSADPGLDDPDNPPPGRGGGGGGNVVPIEASGLELEIPGGSGR